jgi:putative two-component system hydrogenase maturation factor HypX/HoxX
LGLVDEVGPRHPEAYTEWLTALAEKLAEPRVARQRRSAKARRLAAERVPLEAFEARELAEMSRDMFGDRSGFAAARHAFVTKAKPTETPAKLRFDASEAHRPVPITRSRLAVRPAVPISA